MCGIVGFLEPPRRRSPAETRSRLERMRDALRHRGPDDQGSWFDEASGIALGHRRLSILDLSPEGHQPKASADGRYCMVYNGEVYNYRELRQELEGHGHLFSGRSDTEVVLAAFVQWGFEATLPRLNGMFALGVWDSERRRLLVARDRYGKKPLYYARFADSWFFASELKSLKTLDDFPGCIDRRALSLYLRYGYVPSPFSIYSGVWKLPPASWMELDTDSSTAPKVYWEVPSTSGAREAVSNEEIEQALVASVSRRLVSDVPLGAFLSGGIDSSLIVALMCEASPHRVRSFSLGFAESSHDEAIYARRIAQHLGTEHTEHYVDAREALEVVPMLPSLYDEPFSDPSQIPTYLVSRLARQHVTVALSGDGGDEIFGGYNRYIYGPRLWRQLSKLPLWFRRFGAALFRVLPWGRLIGGLGGRFAYPHEKLTKLSEVLDVTSAEELYSRLVSQWPRPEELLAVEEPPSKLLSARPSEDFASWMMRMDCLTYLPDDILVKVDRASMGVGLEARAPFLDPELAELACRLAPGQKIRDGQGKQVLRQLLYKRVPRSLLERPKAGFSLPLGEWLRSELREWTESLLGQVRQASYLRWEPVERRWRQHLRGERDWSASLWTVLMFQAWLSGEETDLSGRHRGFS